LVNVDPDVPSLGLSHIAEEADKLWSSGVSLVLSGHTHSGQITVGDLHKWTLGRLGGHRYVHGLYGCRQAERADGAVYVSAGIGSSECVLRLRDRARSEVALFEPGRDSADFNERHVEHPPLAGRSPPTRKP